MQKGSKPPAEENRGGSNETRINEKVLDEKRRSEKRRTSPVPAAK